MPCEAENEFVSSAHVLSAIMFHFALTLRSGVARSRDSLENGEIVLAVANDAGLCRAWRCPEYGPIAQALSTGGSCSALVLFAAYHVSQVSVCPMLYELTKWKATFHCTMSKEVFGASSAPSSFRGLALMTLSLTWVSFLCICRKKLG